MTTDTGAGMLDDEPNDYGAEPNEAERERDILLASLTGTAFDLLKVERERDALRSQLASARDALAASGVVIKAYEARKVKLPRYRLVYNEGSGDPFEFEPFAAGSTMKSMEVLAALKAVGVQVEAEALRDRGQGEGV